MILRDLIAEVSSLGFDGAIECDTLFLTSLKRCLYEIFTDKKVTSDIVLHKSRERRSAYYPVLRYNGKDQLSLPLRGRAISFYSTGKGSYTLLSRSGSYAFSFSGSSARHAHMLDEDSIEIVFSGDNSYTITGLAVFEDSYASESEIPDASPRRKYDMNLLTDDFLSFDSLARDSAGKVLECVSFESGCVFVDEKYEGDILLTYRRLPHISMTSTPDREIDIPQRYEHLLPVLLSSYIYLDSDAAKAQHYRELYNTMSRESPSDRASDSLSRYRDTNGWA